VSRAWRATASATVRRLLIPVRLVDWTIQHEEDSRESIAF